MKPQMVMSEPEPQAQQLLSVSEAEYIVDMYGAELAAAEATTENWDIERTFTALARVGRNNGPALIVDLLSLDALQDGVLTAVIGDIWSAAEYPDDYLDYDTWRFLFEEAGYSVDGKLAQRPKSPLRLYRGSLESRRANWSWTDNIAIAEKYASGNFAHRPAGLVWTALVQPTRLFACNRVSRLEDEFVVDTTGLLIDAYDPGVNEPPTNEPPRTGGARPGEPLTITIHADGGISVSNAVACGIRIIDDRPGGFKSWLGCSPSPAITAADD